MNQTLRDILIFSTLVLLLVLRYCDRKSESASGIVYKKGIEKRDTVFSHSLHTITGTNTKSVVYNNMTVMGITQQDKSDSVISFVASTSIRDTLDDKNVTIYLNDSLEGKTNLILRRSIYLLKVPLSITKERTDSIFFHPPTPKIKRFGLGLQGGVGVGSTGVQPYIGVGISYNLFQF